MFYFLPWFFIKVVTLLKAHPRVIHIYYLRFVPPGNPAAWLLLLPTLPLCWNSALGYVGSLAVQQHLATFYIDHPAIWPLLLWVSSSDFLMPLLAHSLLLQASLPLLARQVTSFLSFSLSFSLLPQSFCPWSYISNRSFHSSIYEDNTLL